VTIIAPIFVTAQVFDTSHAHYIHLQSFRICGITARGTDKYRHMAQKPPIVAPGTVPQITVNLIVFLAKTVKSLAPA
jgi:hypothetical protein